MTERTTTNDADRSVAALARALGLKFCPTYLKTAEIRDMCYRRDQPGEPAEYHSTMIDPRTDRPYHCEIGALTIGNGGGTSRYRVEIYEVSSNYHHGRYECGIMSRGIVSPNSYSTLADLCAGITATLHYTDLIAIDRAAGLREGYGQSAKYDRAYALALKGDPTLTGEQFVQALSLVLTAADNNRNQPAEWLARTARIVHSNEEAIKRFGYTQPSQADRAIAALRDLATDARGGTSPHLKPTEIRRAAAMAAASDLLIETERAEEGTRDGQYRALAGAIVKVLIGAARASLPGVIRDETYTALVRWASTLEDETTKIAS